MATAREWGLTPGQWWALDVVEQAVMLADAANRADVCPDCGTPHTVGRSPDYLYELLDSPPCHACEAIAADAKQRERAKPRPGIHRTIRAILRTMTDKE